MMSTSASQEGISDIGRTTNKSSNTDNDDGAGGIPNWKERIDISIAKSRKIRGSNYVQISTINYEMMEPRCRTVVFRGFLKGVPFGAMKDVLCSDVGGVEETASQSQPAGGDEENYNCVIKMITDLRSSKVQELEMFHELKDGGKNANTAEMVWWFPKSSEQYRISGRLQFIGSNGPLYSYADTRNFKENNNYFEAERKQQWGNLSDMAREQFYWEKPGVPYSTTWAEAKGVPPGGRGDDGKVLPPPDAFLIMLFYPAKIDYLRLGDNYRQIDEWDWGDGDRGCHWKSMRVNP